MFRYILKRILFGLVTLFMLVLITFFMTHLMPGNPFDLNNVSASKQAEMMAHYGLDQPIATQFFSYVGGLLHGDFGISYKKSGTTVASLILKEAPPTLALGAISYLIALVLGTLFGIGMAVTRRRAVRNSMTALSTIGISVPNYVLALVLMLVFGVTLKWFPVLGLSTPKHYVLPVITLAVYPIAQISRLVKSSYTEAMQQDYVIMARSKGLSSGRIVIVHVLKNAMLPVITASGPMIAFLLTGSFVTEQLFTIPGIGREFVNAVSNRDYTVVMGLTIFIGALIILCNLLSDICCALADPRVKLTD